ncbi:hypothetical protein MHPYR_170108 [uncultured Mycobacterium sp.]|uniref:Uncharacterized protein n=1 Tax=uncultured Mycobacterium sp. TaxID=171292 RepID=A0A1Y5P807_9MYCO|nr:hypothetical protein MHPYR_170108 [uncultured Mycobacterium sp.]
MTWCITPSSAPAGAEEPATHPAARATADPNWTNLMAQFGMAASVRAAFVPPRGPLIDRRRENTILTSGEAAFQ